MMSDFETTSETSSLTGSQEGSFDQADWNTYETGGKSFELPPDDTYILKSPVITDDAFAKGDAGQLKATISPLAIVGGQFNGAEIRFFTASNKRYRNRNASGLGDYLLATNSSARPTSEESWKAAVKATSNRTFSARLRWEGYNKQTKAEFVGMEAFPLLDNGKRQPFIDFNAETNEQLSAADAKTLGRDRTYRVWANLKIAHVIIPGK